MKRRASGILLHISSLPSPYGIGDLGSGAYRFADFLSASSQRAWQILPINPTRVITENSPYSSISAFAGNPLFISPELLYKEGYLSKSDLQSPPSFPEDRVDYPACTTYKGILFETAYNRFKQKKGVHDFERFCEEHNDWLSDYALFVVLKDQFKEPPFYQWPRMVRKRDPQTMAALKTLHCDAIKKEKFLQYLFYRQWHSLKKYCNKRKIEIIGDLPIYVHFDSVEVWTHPALFKLDQHLRPRVFAGVPPDFFSATGQLWTNPIYQWDVLKRRGYRWWIKRVAHNKRLFDRIRLDHFKGFVDYWEVPAREKTAKNGKWKKGPRGAIFRALSRHFTLPFIAEDLGVITKEVHDLRDRFKFPGMRVLQFAFGNDPLAHLYQPHSYIPNSVAYTGTHDNDTLVGWFSGEEDYSTRTLSEVQEERERARRYLGSPGRRKEIHWAFISLLIGSPANLVIFPMQDILGLGSSARMNRPGEPLGNWGWRVREEQLTRRHSTHLRKMTVLGGRG